MNKARRLPIFATLGCILSLAAAAYGGAQADELHERINAVKASLTQSTRALHQYQWMETTTVFIKDEQKSQTIKSCYYGAEGSLEKTQVSSPPPEEHSRGLRGRIKEHKKEELEEYMHKAVELVKSYVPPDPAIIQGVKDRGEVSLQVVDPNRQVNIVVPGYHKTGDSMNISMDVAANRLLGITVNTYLDDDLGSGETPRDPVTMTVTEGTFADGTVYTQHIELDAPSKDIKVTVENSGFVRTSPAPAPAPAPAPQAAAAYAAPAPASAPSYVPSPATNSASSAANSSTAQPPATGGTAYTADALDKILAPIALYPDALILQIVQCASSPYQVRQVNDWLKQNSTLKGTAVQDAATKQGFDASFVAIVLFPQVLQMMADKADWTRELGQAFTTDRSGVFASIQRLRTQAQSVGNLKTNEQQQVQNVTTESGQQVIVIQPANPQVVYVPQYNPQVVYTQPATTTTVVQQSNSGQVAAAAVIGFAAGVIVGAAADNDHDHYYYASGGWGYHGAALCNDGWNDYYDHRENMANDYYDHRENMANDYYDHRENMAAQSGQNQTNRQNAASQNQANRQSTATENQSSRQDSRANTQSNASENQSSRQSSRSETQQTASADRSANQSSRQSSAQQAQANRSASSRGSFQNSSESFTQRSGTSSGAFSGYQRGSTERASSERGSRSMSHSFSGGSRSGGRRR